MIKFLKHDSRNEPSNLISSALLVTTTPCLVFLPPLSAVSAVSAAAAAAGGRATTPSSSLTASATFFFFGISLNLSGNMSIGREKIITSVPRMRKPSHCSAEKQAF